MPLGLGQSMYATSIYLVKLTDRLQMIVTCDPSYYKHTQRLFLMLHERGLAYQAEALVNYDPVDKTVLANEQVDPNGNGWRSGAKVEKLLLKQWFFKISEYRQLLLDDLEYLAEDGKWPKKVLEMQRNWLGKSTGARIKFPVIEYNNQVYADIEVFTTRPDTIFGVQYIALAASHPIVESIARKDSELKAFLDAMPDLPPDSKAGHLLPDIRAINPLAYEDSTPDVTKASLPVYVAPYVLGDYGDGAVMGVPGHDGRDYAFWKHNRHDEPIRIVVAPSPDGSTVAAKDEAFIHQGYLTSHNGSYAGLTTAEATEKIIEFLQGKGLGSAHETWRLRDWLVSRQRYWGTPIPIIHCGDCGAVPVPVEDLPVELPKVTDHWVKGKTGNPLEHAHDWVNTSCPKCGGGAKRDTDTMDTFVDSSWYFFRYLDPENEDMPFSPEPANANMPVDLYIGGVEHAILHLLYSRFISKFLATTPLWPDGHKHRGEPFTRLLTQGMVHGKTYTDPLSSRYLKLDELDISDSSKPVIVATGEIANVTFEKMSKSKYNGVDPGTSIAKHGIDVVRTQILFAAPAEDVLLWDENKIAGSSRWLRRIREFIELSGPMWMMTSHEGTPKQKLIYITQILDSMKTCTPEMQNRKKAEFSEKLKEKGAVDLGEYTLEPLSIFYFQIHCPESNETLATIRDSHKSKNTNFDMSKVTLPSHMGLSSRTLAFKNTSTTRSSFGESSNQQFAVSQSHTARPTLSTPLYLISCHSRMLFSTTRIN